jgi:hypothetical protein
LVAASPAHVGHAATLSNSGKAEPVYLVIRSDDALTSRRFSDTLKSRNIQLLTYRQLIAMQGLQSMHRPAG